MKNPIFITTLLVILSLGFVIFLTGDAEPPQTEIEVILPDDRFPQ